MNSFISEYIYEGKLESCPGNAKRIIEVPTSYQGKLNKEAGIIYVPVNHEGNTQASDEEIAEIRELTNQLLGRTFTAADGHTRERGRERGRGLRFIRF